MGGAVVAPDWVYNFLTPNQVVVTDEYSHLRTADQYPSIDLDLNSITCNYLTCNISGTFNALSAKGFYLYQPGTATTMTITADAGWVAQILVQGTSSDYGQVVINGYTNYADINHPEYGVIATDGCVRKDPNNNTAFTIWRQSYTHGNQNFLCLSPSIWPGSNGTYTANTHTFWDANMGYNYSGVPNFVFCGNIILYDPNNPNLGLNNTTFTVNASDPTIGTCSLWDALGNFVSLNYSGFHLYRGPAYMPGGGSWTATSDETVKENITPFAGGLKEILQLRPVQFQYIDSEYKEAELTKLKATGGKPFYRGLIAQHVQPILPTTVGTRSDGKLTFKQDDVLWALVNAVQEMKKTAEEWEARVHVLEAKMLALQQI